MIQLYLLVDKQVRLRAAIARWSHPRGHQAPRISGRKRDLLSLIRLLGHAAKVVRQGRAFIISLIDGACTVSSLEHHVRLNSTAWQDLAWRRTLLDHWNGASAIPQAMAITSDASGRWGCGAISNDLWMQLQWPPEWAQVSISPKELIPIELAMATLGPQWNSIKV
jgi:hypothetical protein